MRKIGEFLLAHNRNAVIAAFICTLLPLVYLPGGFFAALIVGFVTLRKGAKPGAAVLVWIALPAVALLYLKQFGGFDIILLRAVIVWIMAIVLRAHQSWRLALEVTTLLAVIVILLAHLFMPDLKAFWVQYLNEAMKELNQATNWKLTHNETQSLIQNLAPMATGIYGFILLMATYVQLFLARWMECSMFHPGRLRYEFLRIRMGRVAAIIIALVLLAVFMGSHVAADIFPVLLLPFMISGLSILHYYLSQHKSFLIAVILVYLGLLFLPKIVVLLVSILGFVDAWMDFRVRVQVKPKNLS